MEERAMSGFSIFTGKVAVLDRANVDTDQIIPKQFLKRIERTGFGQFLFYDWRFLNDGSPNPNFELNKPENEGAQILIANENFGCGSSREHAPWALADYGFKVIIAPSFADIFHQNCLKNGLLPISLQADDVQYIMKKANEDGYQLTVSLKDEKVTDDFGFSRSFTIHPYWKKMILNGWDEIEITLQLDDKITEYENKVS